MQKINIISLDIAKNTFHAHCAGADGSVLLRKALPRSRVLEFLARIAPCAVAMEACSGAHYWGSENQGSRPRSSFARTAIRETICEATEKRCCRR
jgi:hypothetical protein